jgi:KRAB domain-containing zinc finger protein
MPRDTKPKHILKQCDYEGCSYSTTKLYNLRRHMCLHTHDYISCDYPGCTNKFTCQSAKTLHIGRSHLGENMLMCEICSKSYKSPSGLSVHKAVAHEREGKHKCDLCTETFFYSKALDAHMAKHTNIHPYYCANCGRGFTYKQSVTRHEQEGICKKQEVPVEHTCDQCQKSFASKMRLAEHISGMHGEKTQQCPCGKKFSWRQSYHRHTNVCLVYYESTSKDNEDGK